MKEKRQGKLKQHISILIEGQATPILSYSIKEVSDPYCGKQGILTLKSLIKSAMFSPGLVGKTTDIVIPTDTETLHFCGYCSGFFNGVPLLEMTFRLIENEDCTQS